MQRVKRSTAVAVMPAAPAGGTPGYFPKPDPQAGVPAAVPGYEWFNSIQEELCSVIAAAGIALDVSNTAQLLAALRSAGVFQTPAQFDNSTKAPTTAFIKGVGVEYGGVLLISTTPLAVTPAAHAGKIIYAGTGASVINLPAVSGFPAGASITIQAAVPVTINRNGADTIFTNGSGKNSVALGNGDSITLIAAPIFNGWVSPGNSAQLVDSAAFGSSLGVSGYQKLPSGLILQWGTDSPSVSNTRTLTFPLAFPTACVFATYIGNNATMQGGQYLSSKSATNFVWNWTTNATGSAYWFAIGY